MGVMESIYTELTLYGSNNECARTDTVFLPISEICDGTVSLMNTTASVSLCTKLESMARYAGKFPAPAEVFSLWQRPFLPFGQIESMLFLPILITFSSDLNNIRKT